MRQGCYLYVPSTEEHEIEQRPSKRRKAAHSNRDTEHDWNIFPPLLSGLNSVQRAKRRQSALRKCWSKQDSQIKHILEPVENAVLDDILHFVKDSPTGINREKIRTGLIACGAKAGSQTRLLEKWRSIEPQQRTAIVFSLNSAQSPNLMTTLKNVIRTAIAELDGVDGYQTFLSNHKRRIPMNYDLELLQEFMTLRDVRKCVIYLTDIETFNIGVLAEVVSVLHDWKDRIPFILLLGISTAVELFEARLPRSTIRLLDCRLFDVSVGADPCSDIYQKLYDDTNSLTPFLGPVAGDILLEMAREQDASATSFTRAIQYPFMSHFFANELSILLTPDGEDSNNNRELCEAIRHTDSFRAHAEAKLDEGDARNVRELLHNDEAVLAAAKEAVHLGREAISRHQAAVEIFEAMIKAAGLSDTPPDPFALRVEALSGASFLDSALYTESLSNLTILPSDRMRSMLEAIQHHDHHSHLNIDHILEKLNEIAPASTNPPIRSAHDPTHTTTSTTITNNKVSLSKHGPKLSPKETAYTAIVDEIVSALTSYFETNIVNPTTLFMHEAFVYNLKIPLATAFSPRPRYVTERALSSPYDYLGCECCSGQAKGQISPTQPPTSVLWQLWCEAGGIVNVRDLWDAFAAVVVDRKEDDEEEDKAGQVNGAGKSINGEEGGGMVDERMALALFYRGLAELRMMGFVKGTKRKVDCLAKTAWRGM